jgi:hypothetical protein
MRSILAAGYKLKKLVFKISWIGECQDGGLNE